MSMGARLHLPASLPATVVREGKLPDASPNEEQELTNPAEKKEDTLKCSTNGATSKGIFSRAE